MLIDCHVHAYTEQEISDLIESMRNNGINKSIIMCWPNKGGWKVPLFSEFMKNVSHHKSLFLAGSMRVTDDKNFSHQFENLRSMLEKKQIIGVKLYLGYEHFFANDNRCDDIYRLCIKHDVPVIFHTGDTLKIKDSVIRYANPIYIDDVASRYPKLRIQISHLGNPWIRETAELIYRNKNVYTDFSGTLSEPGRFEMQANDYLKKHIMELVAYCGTPRKLLFGTDYDLYTQEQYIEFLDSFTEFSKTDLEYIKHRNAEKIFRI